MKKEYMKPEVELVKFVEAEDLMTGDTITGNGVWGEGTGGVTNWYFSNINPVAL